MAIPLIAFYRFQAEQVARIPGFFAVSTAPPNIEEQSNDLVDKLNAKLPDLQPIDSTSGQDPIRAIAREIIRKSGGQEVDLVIAIHGYNTDIVAVKDWYKKIWLYANQHIANENAVFLGYRWSSETVGNIPRNLIRGIRALPVLLALFLFGGLVGAIWSALAFDDLSWVFVVSFFLAMLVITLLLLRMVVYFRDTYRATNFGVPDLVELIRRLDQALDEESPQMQKPFVKLSFIAHSMGGFVTTNTVRILSDVFAPEAIGSTSGKKKKPSRQIGRVFSLGRLVLASPDIPSAAIISGRANFLKSSLRRFEETYLFSNEGDLALRIASTAANYFIFPTNRKILGHRLGNVAVRTVSKNKKYGVINQDDLDNTNADLDKLDLSKYLEINTLLRGIPLTQLQPQTSDDEAPVVDLFTYFDCTDYFDRKYPIKTGSKPQKLLCYRLDRPWLNFLVYPWLMFNWMILRTIDVHGGYFDGDFTSKTIYSLAFVGFRKYLCTLPEQASIDPTQMNLAASCDNLKDLFDREFVQLCFQKRIQVVFSPERYWVNVLGEAEAEATNLEQVREAILNQQPLPEQIQRQLNQ